MTNDELINEDEIRRFLLDRLDADDRAALEARLIAEADFFEAAAVVEDELIDDYLRKRLTDADRADFERVLLATPRQRERVAIARALNARLVEGERTVEATETKPGFFDWLFRPQFAFAAFGILVAVFGAWFVFVRRAPEPTAGLATPTPTVAATPVSTPAPVIDNVNTPAANSVENNPVNKPKPSPTPVEQPLKPVFATILLGVGGVRDGGSVPTVRLNAKTTIVGLVIDIGKNDYKSYRVEVVDAEGRVVATRSGIRAAGGRVSLPVASAKFADGDFIARVSGVGDGDEQSVADYQFRVSRK